MLLKGAQIVAEVLIEQGVDTLFGYPGGTVLDIYDALYEYRDKITHYITAHEQGAAHAADGYARATGKTGVVLATSGPGATNLVTGIATAYMDSIPLVAITGNVATSLIGKDSFQEVYIAGITMPITKQNFVVRKPEQLADTLRKAFLIAASGRPGPVLVDIPKDISQAVVEFTPGEKVVPRRPKTFSKEKADRAVAAIREAKRPIVYFGGGVKLANAGDELRAFIRKLNIPATHTIMGTGVLKYDMVENLGLIGMHGCVTANRAVDEADVVIAVGTRFSDRVALNTKEFARRATIIHIDIDSSEFSKNVATDIAVGGDVEAVLTYLTDQLPAQLHAEWFRQIMAWRLKDYQPADSDAALKPHQIMDKICDLVQTDTKKDAIYVTDVGQHQMWAAQYLRHRNPRSFLTSGGLGTMGFGYGAAIGAQIACPENRVIHITGDGSFHMNMNEACTAVSYGLPIITVICNNAVLGMVRQWQGAFYGRRFSASEPERKTNYVKVIEGFGGKGFLCETPAEFETAMTAALKENGPVWIVCQIDREEKVLPMIAAGKTVADIITE